MLLHRCNVVEASAPLADADGDMLLHRYSGLKLRPLWLMVMLMLVLMVMLMAMVIVLLLSLLERW